MYGVIWACPLQIEGLNEAIAGTTHVIDRIQLATDGIRRALKYADAPPRWLTDEPWELEVQRFLPSVGDMELVNRPDESGAEALRAWTLRSGPCQ